MTKKPDAEALKKLEDEVRERIDGWDDVQKAIAYHYLYVSGMRLEKANETRRKAGATQ